MDEMRELVLRDPARVGLSWLRVGTFDVFALAWLQVGATCAVRIGPVGRLATFTSLPPLAPRFASLSARSLPVIPAFPGTQWNVTATSFWSWLTAARTRRISALLVRACVMPSAALIAYWLSTKRKT